jgi:hypothetical protein
MTTHILAAAVLAMAACAGPSFNLHAAAAGELTGPGDHTVAIVRVHAPWYAPRFMIARKFRAAVPEYEQVAGLETKHFTISDDREFGGVYLWMTRGAADAFYTDVWRRDIHERRGVDPDLLVLAAPFLIKGRATIDGDPIGARSLSYDGIETLVLAPAATGDPIERARTLAARVKELDGLVRGEAVIGPVGVGFVALWATRDYAEAATARLHELGLDGARVTYFEAPVLVDASLRRALPSDGR